ncbi:MAG: cytochrome c [Pseudomonadales bacterium]|nr:cytochrome c [Pseudomonadales bacterium]MCP5303027.1 cytochrome c [Pseudomonadales bacterium]
MNDRFLLKACSYWLGTVITFFTVGAIANDQAADDQAKIAACVACHGADGIGKADQYPNLQGQREAYMVKQLKAFQSGARKDATMTTVVKSISEADMKMLAKFFTQVK